MNTDSISNVAHLASRDEARPNGVKAHGGGDVGG